MHTQPLEEQASMSETEPAGALSEPAAVALVAASVRRLFSFVSERQARDLAAAVLRDLRRQNVWLARETGTDGTGG